ncbi:glycoside hydrolase family 3 N-terminal domain-containing protein [Streptomyces lavendulae]
MTEGAADGRDRPLLLSVNQEGGRLNALDWPDTVQLPGNAALGLAGSAELAELAGAAIGRQLRAVGLCWNLAPVCDLDTVPSTSAVSCRAFCADPVVAGRLAAAFVRGMQSARVAATAKHFPGLGGVAADPHHRTPVVERLAPGCLLPFEAVIGAGVASVMVGSHVVRELDSRPAFASARVIGLLTCPCRLSTDRWAAWPRPRSQRWPPVSTWSCWTRRSPAAATACARLRTTCGAALP